VPPELTIVAPTHEGRRKTLGQLIESVRFSLERSGEPAEVLEISIHDDASKDGTEQMVAELAAACPFLISYGRSAEVTGLARNLVATMRQASGRFCWTLGSDDLVGPDGIAVVLRALRRNPHVTGLVVGSVDVDASDPSLRSRQPPGAFFPEPREYTVFRGAGPIFDQCGNAWGSLAWSVVHRERWLAALARDERTVFENPVFPQLVAEALATLDHPVWAWEPRVAAHRRGAETWLFEDDSMNLARSWALLLSSNCDAWAAVLGGRGRRWRRRVRRVQEVWGRADDARSSRLYESPPARDQLKMLFDWGRSLWPAGAFWREVLPILLTPPRLTKRLHSSDRGGGSAVGAGAAEVRLEAAIPGVIVAGSAPVIGVGVGNAGRRPIPGTGPAAVGIWQRWRRLPERELVGWEELRVNELGAMPADLQRRVGPGRAVTVDLALMAPHEPGRYELTIAGHQHGIGWLNDHGSPPLLAEIEVSAPL